MDLDKTSLLLRHWFICALALIAVAVSAVQLLRSTSGLVIEHFAAGAIPITTFKKDTESFAPGPLVIVAHGFAGSRPMMQQFAVSLAQNGYLAVSFVFSGR